MNLGFSRRWQVLHLRHHPPLAGPTLAGLVAEFLELPHGFPHGLLQLPDHFHLGHDPLLQPIVLRQPQDVVNAFLLAPDHQLVVAESAVSPNRDPHLGPRFTQPPHDPFQLRHPPVGRALIRRAQPRTQQVLPTEDVQWQVVCCGPGYVADGIQHNDNKQVRTRIGNIVLVVIEPLFGRFSPCSRH